MELFQLVKKGLDTNQIFAEHFSHRSFGSVIRRVSDAHKAGKVQERQVREGVQPGDIDVGRSVAGEDGAPLLRTVYKTFAQSLKAERKDRVKSDEEVQGRATYKRAKRRKGKWAPEVDEMLEQLVGRNAHLPEPAIWYKVSGGRLRVDDFPLLRDSVSCCRCWRHLHPPASHQSGRWTNEEERRLQQAIWEQLEGKYQVAVDVFPNKPATTKHTLGAWRPELVQLPGQEGLPILKEGSRRLGLLNWLLIAEKIGSRSDIDSRNHFYWIYHNASRGPWSKEEMARGKEGWEKFGKDYHKITVHVGMRSSTQVTKMICYWEYKRKKDEAKATAEAVNEAKSKSIKNPL
ncbi:MAG: hypothetical protein J3R72DRAFT_488083 [Linnemannia gamsii]|nr:MAG: hypothetical protein J3R72DRAFT_488083 [Linnemannia gamsii]